MNLMQMGTYPNGLPAYGYYDKEFCREIVSVNLGEIPDGFDQESSWFFDINNNRKDFERLTREGVIVETGVTRQSGFVTYPLVTFVEATT